MWYILAYAKTHIYPSCDCGRPADPARRVALVQCLCITPLPNPASQHAWPDRPRDCRGPGLRRPDGPQCDARLQYAGTGRAAATVLRATAHPTCRLRSNTARAVARRVAPVPPQLRQTPQCVDVAPGRRGGVCQKADAPAGQGRNHPPSAGVLGRPVEAGQTRDHQSRPGVHPEKKQRDRLIRLAATHPAWVLGFGDEVWWSRLAQPSLHTWAPTTPAVRLATGHPVIGVTAQFLACCCDRFEAWEKQALLLVWDNASWHKSQEVRTW